jgi:hypothetical protein
VGQADERARGAARDEPRARPARKPYHGRAVVASQDLDLALEHVPSEESLRDALRCQPRGQPARGVRPAAGIGELAVAEEIAAARGQQALRLRHGHELNPARDDALLVFVHAGACPRKPALHIREVV